MSQKTIGEGIKYCLTQLKDKTVPFDIKVCLMMLVLEQISYTLEKNNIQDTIIEYRNEE